jgi:hypothetical protein
MGNAEQVAPKRQQTNEILKMNVLQTETIAGISQNQTRQNTPQDVKRQVEVAPKNYQIERDEKGDFTRIYSVTVSNAKEYDIRARGVDASGSNEAAGTWEAQKASVRENAQGLEPGKTVPVTIYGITPEQFEGVKKALVASGVEEKNIKWDGVSVVGYKVKSENYEGATVAAIDAKKDGPNPGKGMTDFFGAQIMVMKLSAEIYAEENKGKVDGILKFVEKNPNLLKPVATIGGTDFSVAKYSEKNDWFVGTYKDEKSGNEYTIIKATGAENKTYVIPKGAISYTNNTEVGVDGISFSHESRKSEDMKSPTIQNQVNLLKSVNCFGEVNHILINNKAKEVNPGLKNILTEMKQGLKNQSETQASQPKTFYFALERGQEAPKGAVEVAKIRYEETTVTTYGDQKVDEKTRKTIKVPKIDIGIGSKTEGGGSGACDAYGTSSGYSGSTSTFLTSVFGSREITKVEDRNVPYDVDGKMVKFEVETLTASPLMPSYKPWETNAFLASLDRKIPAVSKEAMNGKAEIRAEQPSVGLEKSNTIGVTVSEYKPGKNRGEFEATVNLVWNNEPVTIKVTRNSEGSNYVINDGAKTLDLTKNVKKPWSVSVDQSALGGEFALANRIYTPIEGKEKFDVQYVSLDKSKMSTSTVTADNYPQLMPNIIMQNKDGTAAGAVLAVKPSGKEFGADAPALVHMYHEGTVQASNLGSKEVMAYLSKMGCNVERDGKNAMAAANDRIGYAVEGENGKAYIIKREETGSQQVKYSIHAAVINTEMELSK